MTVAELIKELEKMPQDYKVVHTTCDEYGECVLEYISDINVIKHGKQIELY